MNRTRAAAAAFPSVIGVPGSDFTNRVYGIGHHAAARSVGVEERARGSARVGSCLESLASPGYALRADTDHHQ